jgi:hypothetical protein
MLPHMNEQQRVAAANHAMHLQQQQPQQLPLHAAMQTGPGVQFSNYQPQAYAALSPMQYQQYQQHQQQMMMAQHQQPQQHQQMMMMQQQQPQQQQMMMQQQQQQQQQMMMMHQQQQQQRQQQQMMMMQYHQQPQQQLAFPGVNPNAYPVQYPHTAQMPPMHSSDQQQMLHMQQPIMQQPYATTAAVASAGLPLVRGVTQASSVMAMVGTGDGATAAVHPHQPDALDFGDFVDAQSLPQSFPPPASSSSGNVNEAILNAMPSSTHAAADEDFGDFEEGLDLSAGLHQQQQQQQQQQCQDIIQHQHQQVGLGDQPIDSPLQQQQQQQQQQQHTSAARPPEKRLSLDLKVCCSLLNVSCRDIGGRLHRAIMCDSFVYVCCVIALPGWRSERNGSVFSSARQGEACLSLFHKLFSATTS